MNLRVFLNFRLLLYVLFSFQRLFSLRTFPTYTLDDIIDIDIHYLPFAIAVHRNPRVLLYLLILIAICRKSLSCKFIYPFVQWLLSTIPPTPRYNRCICFHPKVTYVYKNYGADITNMLFEFEPKNETKSVGDKLNYNYEAI